jgi:hypothetical protein
VEIERFLELLADMQTPLGRAVSSGVVVLVALRSARRVKDDATRRILDRFAAAGIRVASTTQDVTVHPRG